MKSVYQTTQPLLKMMAGSDLVSSRPSHEYLTSKIRNELKIEGEVKEARKLNSANNSFFKH